MITLQVGKKEVELPDRLSIRQYQQMRVINDLDKSPIEFITAISGLDKSEVKYAKKKDMDFVFRFLIENYLVKQNNTLQPIIVVEGIEYGLMSDMTSLNFGGWVDLEFLTTDGVEKNMDKIMAIMYRPIKEKTPKGFILTEYDHDEMEQRAEIFLDAPVEYFWGISNFFFKLVKAYTENMKASLEYQRTKEKALTRLRMMNPLYHLSKLYQGSTGHALCHWLKRTSQKLIK